ncbi:HipA domain-containing protein [Algibacter sp. 2305UL17-15]|uniref:HipA domain-containing protein n=1 Tax=Algibacter sp. 2305UL17-15 TaxID=3231268 RepID=UPI00345846EA
MSSCLACHKPLASGDHRYHPACLVRFWEKDTPVFQLEYDISQINELAEENVAQRIIVTGVQPKLSMGFAKTATEERLTIDGALNGRYILKPPYSAYPQMPEIEALCMLMTQACGIETVPFLLLPLRGGELAYITRRIDRNAQGDKFAMEDACQFNERLTEHKYRGSYEQIAKGIIAYSKKTLKDVVRFYEQVIVSFLIGNNDMHLKNFSLIAKEFNQYELTPAYDMIAAQLLLPDDLDDLALNLNGKKRKLKRNDFNEAMLKAHIPEKAIENLWKRIERGMSEWSGLIERSFLDDERKTKFKELINKKIVQLEFTVTI